MSEASSSDKWGIASAGYAAKAEHVIGPAAEQLINWVHEESSLSTPLATALDNGAGTGIVTATLRARFPNLPILAADLSPGMLETIGKRNIPQVRYGVLDAIDLRPIADKTFTHSLSTFMVQFTSDPFLALKEMYRVTTAGGTLGLGLWGKICFDAPWEETVRHFEPDYTFPHTWTPDWADKKRLGDYIAEAGFKEIQVKTVRLGFDFGSLEEYMDFFLKSGNPELMRGYQPWWDKGMERIMRPMLASIVREKYGSAKDFELEAFLFLAKK